MKRWIDIFATHNGALIKELKFTVVFIDEYNNSMNDLHAKNNQPSVDVMLISNNGHFSEMCIII